MQNNIIARQVGEEFRENNGDASVKDVVKAVLDKYKNGMYTITGSQKSGFKVERTNLSDKQHKQILNALSNLNENGYTPEQEDKNRARTSNHNLY